MRKRSLSSMLMLALLVASLGACGDSCSEPTVEHPEPPVAPPPPPQLQAASFELDSGLHVTLVSGPCGGDRAGAALLFALGTDHDPAGRSGMLRVIERILADSIEGAQVHVGADHTLVSLDTPAAEMNTAITALASSMASLEIDEATLASAQASVLAELERMRGTDAALTARAFAAESIRATRGQGFGGGVATEITAIGLDELRAFVRAHLQPGNARLVVVGQLDPAATRTHIEASLGGLDRGEPPVAREASDARVTGTLVFGDAPTALALALPAPPTDDPLFGAFLLLSDRIVTASPNATWDADYEPLLAPEALFISAPLIPGETPEAAAAALRADVIRIASAAWTDADSAAAAQRFELLLGGAALEPATCERDPRQLAIAYARRAQLGLDALPLTEGLSETTPDQLTEVTALVGQRRSAAIAAGGAIR